MDKKQVSFFLPNKKQKEYQPGQQHIDLQNGGKKTFKPRHEKKEMKMKQQDNFDKNREGLQSSESNTKKPFDKKTYRLKKYSKKYKLEQWEEQRKKKLIRNYYKDVKNDETAGSYTAKIFDEDVTDSNNVGRFVKHPDLIEKENEEREKQQELQKKKKDPFQKAKDHYNKLKQEKLDKKEEIEKAKEERNKKLQEYKKKKQERFKKLSKKTKKGQPVMTGRLELLLEKLQKPQ